MFSVYIAGVAFIMHAQPYLQHNSVFTSFSGLSFVAGSNDDKNIVWLGKYSKIPNINNIGDMVWY